MTDLISQPRARGRSPRGRRECEHSLDTFVHPAHAVSRAWSRAVCAHSSRARRRNATRPEICAPRTPGQDTTESAQSAYSILARVEQAEFVRDGCAVRVAIAAEGGRNGTRRGETKGVVNVKMFVIIHMIS